MTQTKSPPKVTAQDGPGRPLCRHRAKGPDSSSRDERVAVHQAEDEVGRLLPAMKHFSITQQLQVLREGEYVIEAPDDRRRMTLSDAGRRWWRGIEALAPRAA